MSTDEIQKEINNLSLSQNFLEILLHVTRLNLNFNSNTFGSRDVYQTLNENEISFLYGYYLKNRHHSNGSVLDFKRASTRLMELMNLYHENYLPKLGNLNGQKNFHEAMRTSEANIQETIFYAGSGAYDYQYVDFVVDKYAQDIAWLKKNKNFSPDAAKRFFYYVKSLMHYKLNNRERKFSLHEMYSFKIDNYVFKKNPEFLDVLKAFTIAETEDINNDYNNIYDLNEIKIRPIIQLGNSYYIPISFLLSEAIYDSPFYWMVADKAYANIALKNRGIAAEKMVSKILRKKIHSTKILEGVELKRSRKETITDLDICIKENERMIIFQVKSKRLREISKRGNPETFEEDFKKAILNANEQAEIAYQPILRNESYLLDEKSGEKIDISKVNKIYHACLLLDGYGALTNHTRMFFYEKDYIPITMSIFDLDIIMEYVKDLDGLFHYFERRTELSKICFASSELSFFAMYLLNGLNFKEQEKKNDEQQMFFIDNSYAQRFDGEYYVQMMLENKDFLYEIAKSINRNDKCYCGSGKKLKLCCNKIEKDV
ncbi:SEC-C metal-binding domain-containing protein [Salinimicrobium sp. TIG7-5_MAKvit]|uniref:SEC-C metal-binding domain-containing protein n=1 Tax=Salinimicrobium sp. TIG7-5_MAKvit TaxID=3121289 RepID=UPI003C6E4C2C